MSSSIFSSRTLRVAFVVLVVMAGVELFTRFKLFRMSKDFRRFTDYPALASTLDRPVDIAFIGNSATLRGVDPTRFAQALREASGIEARAGLFTADASRINTWHYMLEHYFWRPRVGPRTFVITFYEDDLADGNRIEIGRLAQFFTDWRDWPEVLGTDLTDFGQRAEFIVSSLWATQASRARIRERTLGLIPGYGDYLTEANQALYRHRQGAEPPRRKRTHAALERLLARAHDEGSRLIFVAYPTLACAHGKCYDLDPETVGIVRQAGMTLIDLRHAPELGPERYADDVHLDDEGRARFSRMLGRALELPR